MCHVHVFMSIVFCGIPHMSRKVLQADEKDPCGWVSSATRRHRAQLDNIPLVAARMGEEIMFAVPATPASMRRALV
jgi:hypothetical protein